MNEPAPLPTPVLETRRLVLRAMREGDAESLHPTLADAELMTWWSSAAHRDIEETREYLLPRVGERRWRSWAITLAGEDVAIGWVSVGNRREGVSEIGYLLARDHWGGGLAQEAVSAVLDQLFHAEGHRRVFADTDPDNAGSNALLGRLGFILEGRLRAEWETHIGVRDSYIWGLLNDEWRGAA